MLNSSASLKSDAPALRTGSAPENAPSPSLQDLRLRMLLGNRTLSLRSEVFLGDPLYADLVVFSRNLSGGDGVRLSVFVGTAREASGLKVWIVSARMNSRGKGAHERMRGRRNRKRVNNCRLVRVRSSNSQIRDEIRTLLIRATLGDKIERSRSTSPMQRQSIPAHWTFPNTFQVHHLCDMDSPLV